MARLEQAGGAPRTVLTRFRLGLLSCASLVAPAIVLAHDLEHGDHDMAVVTAGSAALFGLVILRMAGLLRRHERSLEHERTLSSAGAALVSATGRGEIERVAVRSARALGGPGSTAVVVEEWECGAARAGLGLHAAQDRALALDITPSRAARAVLVVSGPAVEDHSVQAALRALATQIALALDSAALGEEVHRRRSEARFGSLVRHSSDLIIVLGPDGRVDYQSPSIQRVLGYEPGEFVAFGDLVSRWPAAWMRARGGHPPPASAATSSPSSSRTSGRSRRRPTRPSACSRRCPRPCAPAIARWCRAAASASLSEARATGRRPTR
jgi:PAS domain-containing protein